MNFTKLRPILFLCLITLISTLLFWGVFYFNLPRTLGFPEVKMETLYANYDGPNYLAISKCGYEKSCLARSFSLPQPLEYYPAHFPGFPWMISIFNAFFPGPKAMLLVTLFGSLLLSSVSYLFFSQFLRSKVAFWLSFVFIFFPARIFVLRQIGAPETWFISFLLLSLIFFRRRSFWFSAIFLSLAQVIKTPAVLLLVAYGFQALAEKPHNFKKYLPFFLVPLTVLWVFWRYQIELGDFWAYFHSGDNIHLTFLPYQVFVSNRSWIQTIWLEDVIYLFVFALTSVIKLFKRFKTNVIFFFPLIFSLASILVAHRDISRYIAPIYPFMLLAFAKTLNSKTFRLVFWLVFPALILYAINFTIGNTAPIADWTPYL